MQNRVRGGGVSGRKTRQLPQVRLKSRYQTTQHQRQGSHIQEILSWKAHRHNAAPFGSGGIFYLKKYLKCRKMDIGEC